MNKVPKTIEITIEWSFSTPKFDNYQNFLIEVEGYNKEITKEMGLLNPLRVLNWYNRKKLEHDTGFQKMKLTYEYSVEKPNGDWIDRENTIEIETIAESLTIGEILYHLHNRARDHLADQDHSFFEGLELMEGESTENTPKYYVLLGS